MNLVPPKDSPDKSDLKPSFRKPSNDSVNRKYRHHSPVDGSDSSSSGGIPKHEHHNSSGNSMANRHKISDERDRKYHGKEPDRDPGHSNSTRGSDSYRYSDKKTRRRSANYQHSDEGGYHRLANDEDTDSIWYSKDGRELRSGRPDFSKHTDSSERSKENNRKSDRHVERHDSREKYETSGHRSRVKDQEVNAPDHRYNEIESSIAAIGSKQMTSRRDIKRGDERDSLRERADRDDRRTHHRSPSDYRKEYVPSLDDSRGNAKNSFSGRESVVYRQRESQRKEVDEQDFQVQKKRYNDKDTRRYEEKHPLDHDKNRKEKSDSYLDKTGNAIGEQNSLSKRLKSGESDKFPRSMAEGKSSTSTNQVNDANEKFLFGPTSSANNHIEPAQDFNAAKVAAMKAAELVNKNLVGTGGLSTDQKKKLLWGSKNSSEESGSRWDLQLFTDRERQEKFNKLMGVKGEAAPQERKPDEKDAEKQKELQMDLEKQYTAGLRRRDGRTVGLGL